jgi:O-antigen/teichoic acid export membrane protein
MLGRKTLFVFFIHLILQIIDGLSYLFAVKTFSTTNFGYQQAALSIIAFFKIISMLSFNTANIKIMSQNENSDKNFTHYMIMKIFLITLAFFITLLIFRIQVMINVLDDSMQQEVIFIILFITNILNSISDIFSSAFIALQKVVKMQIPILFGSLIGSLFSFTSIFVFKNFIIYISGNLIKFAIILFIYMFFTREFKFKKLDFKLLKTYFFVSFILYIPVIFNLLSHNLGVLIFLNYYPENLLGIYYVFIMLFDMIIGVELTLKVLLIPNFSSYIRTKKINRIRKSIKLFQKYILVLNTFLIIFGIIFSEYLIKTFLGITYFSQGSDLYYLLLLSLLIFPLKEGYFNLIIANDNIKFFLIIALGNFVFSILSWIFLIPSIDIIAIKLGIWLFSVPTIILLRYKSYKEFKIGKLDKEELMCFSLILCTIFFSFLITNFIVNFLLKIIFFIIVSAFFIGSLFILRIFTSNDLEYLKDVFNPKKMINLIIDNPN